MPRSSQSGITLMELMVVTLIIAVLAGIGYPSYQSQVRKSRRAAVQAFLMDVATRQQQRMVDVRSYAAAFEDLRMPVPADLAGFYSVVVVPPEEGEAPGFTLEATPLGAQLEDPCGVLTLDQAGRKTRDTCW